MRFLRVETADISDDFIGISGCLAVDNAATHVGIYGVRKKHIRDSLGYLEIALSLSERPFDPEGIRSRNKARVLA